MKATSNVFHKQKNRALADINRNGMRALCENAVYKNIKCRKVKMTFGAFCLT